MGINTCRVAVAGLYSSGKSALINYLLKGETYAKEGVTPTTRACTEYGYSPQESYEIVLKDGTTRRLSRQEYMTSSVAEGCCEYFRVGVPNEFLRENDIVILDTPGYCNNERENVVAEQAISGADAVIWLVNVSSEAASLKDKGREFLFKTTQRKGHEIPVLLLLTQIDEMNPVRGGTVRDAIYLVKQNLLNEMKDEKYPIHLVYPPLCITTRTGNVKRSIRDLVMKQDEELGYALNVCLDSKRKYRKSVLANEIVKRKAVLEARRIEVYGDVERAKSYLKEREVYVERFLRDEIEAWLKDLLENVARSISYYSPCVKAWASSSDYWTWPDYSACFIPTLDIFNLKDVYTGIRDIVCKYIHGRISNINEGLNKVVIYLDSKISKVSDDSWWGDAEKNARIKMVAAIRSAMMNNENLNKCAVKFFDSLSLSIASYNDEEITNQKKQIASLEDELAGIVRELESL